MFVFQVWYFISRIAFQGNCNPLHFIYFESPYQVSFPLPNDNNCWLTYKYHLPGRLGRLMIFPFFKLWRKGSYLISWKKNNNTMPFTKTWGEAKHDRCWVKPGGFPKVVFVVATILVILWYVIVASKPCVNPEGWSVVACWLRSFPITCG